MWVLGQAVFIPACSDKARRVRGGVSKKQSSTGGGGKVCTTSTKYPSWSPITPRAPKEARRAARTAAQDFARDLKSPALVKVSHRHQQCTCCLRLGLWGVISKAACHVDYVVRQDKVLRWDEVSCVCAAVGDTSVVHTLARWPSCTSNKQHRTEHTRTSLPFWTEHQHRQTVVCSAVNEGRCCW